MKEMKKIGLVIALGIFAFSGVFGAERPGIESAAQTGQHSKFKKIIVENDIKDQTAIVYLNEGVTDAAGKIEAITLQTGEKTIPLKGDGRISTIRLTLKGKEGEKSFEEQTIDWAGPNIGKLPKPLEGVVIKLKREGQDTLRITIRRPGKDEDREEA